MQRKQRQKPIKQQRIASSRIRLLFDLASEIFDQNSALSNKYVNKARKIAMKYKTGLPSDLKKRMCKNCHAYLVPSVNCRVRIHKHRVIYFCQKCRHYMRHPLNNKD